MMWLFPWGLWKLSMCEWEELLGEGATSTILPYCRIVGHRVFTVLASVENWESYLRSQCGYWLCGNGTPRKPCESQIRKMLWVYRTVTTAEACALCYNNGVSKMLCIGQGCLAGLEAVVHSETGGAWRSFLRTGTYWLSFEQLSQVHSSCFQTGAEE